MSTPSETEAANVETVRKAVDAFNRGDIDALRELGGDDFEYDWSRSMGPNADIYRGTDRFFEFVSDQWDLFEDMRLDVNEFIPRGNHVIITTTVHGRGRQGVPVSANAAHLYTFADDGRLVRVTLFQEREEALAASR